MKLYILGAGTSTDCGIAPLNKVTEAVVEEYRLSTLTEAYFSSDAKQQEAYKKRKEIADTYERIVRSISDDERKNFDLLYKKLSDEEKKVFKTLYFWYFWDRRNHSARNSTGIIESSRALQLLYRALNVHTDKVISFNYDIMFEEAITYVKNRSYKYHYGFSGNKSDKLEILKPMGSINWLLLNEGQTLRYKDYVAGRVKHMTAVVGDENLRKNFYVDENTILCEVRNYFEAFDRIVYRPSYMGTDVLHEKYPKLGNLIWDKAFRYLKEAEQVILVGFNPIKGGSSDQIQLFIKNILSAKSIVCVNPDYDNSIEDYIKQNVLKATEITFVKQKFGEWIAKNHEKNSDRLNVEDISKSNISNIVPTHTIAASATNYESSIGAISVSGDESYFKNLQPNLRKKDQRR